MNSSYSYERGGHMEITYYVQRNYGKDTFYPVSKDAKMVADIAGAATLTQNMISLLEWYGIISTEVLKPKS
jgi:hypothetical protein